jgi:hypothetical protein
MAIETVRAKLNEARSFLAEMRDQEQRAFGDKKAQFDKALSGCLGAGRSAVYRLEKMPGYKTWREAWNAQNPSKDSLLKSVHDKRNTDVHERGFGHIAKPVEIKVGIGGSYSDKSGTLQSWGSPSPSVGVDTRTTVHLSQHFFDVDGTERPVTEVCAEYLTVLEQMVAQYEADTSQ